MNALQEYRDLHGLIRASEDWSTEYEKDPKSHATLISAEGDWELKLNQFFRHIANTLHNRINWTAYLNHINKAIQADNNPYDFSVVVTQTPTTDQQDADLFMQLSINLVAEMTYAGVQAGEVVYKLPSSISSTSANIQKLTTDHVANLIGKTVEPDGKIVDNPKATMNITETMRNDIVQSLKTSAALGEDIDAATKRVQQTIVNPKRAQVIARTESVNSYQQGLRQFAIDTQAVGKEWQDIGAIDICSQYAALGPVPIDQTYDGLDGPTAHPNCRCGLRYIYQKEWNEING